LLDLRLFAEARALRFVLTFQITVRSLSQRTLLRQCANFCSRYSVAQETVVADALEAVGQHVADVKLAPQLAEIGTILLMFGATATATCAKASGTATLRTARRSRTEKCMPTSENKIQDCDQNSSWWIRNR
jgi:hypothetical protein